MSNRHTFRAAIWTDGQGGELLLTTEEHAAMPDTDLLAEAEAEAARAGIDLSGGNIIVCDWTE
jgi:purine-nucleoside phosphorylase